MAKAPVLKTGGRKPLQVRILCPPSTHPGRFMHAVVALVLSLSASGQTQYDTVFDQIKNLAPQPNAVAAVHGLVLHRDVMELHLDEGVAYQLTPVAGRTTAIAF